jgi:apolipoprotein N-acyltransferase
VRQLPRFFSKIPWRYVAAGTFSAALLVATFPSYSVWWLTFVGMVPLLLVIIRARRLREVAWAGAACTIFFILFGFGWISLVATNFGGLPWIVGKAILLIFSLFGEIQFFLFALLARVLLERASLWRGSAARGAAWFLGLPLAYIGIDFLNPKIFPNTLGHVLYNWLPVAQIAEYTGVYGLTFPIVLANLGFAIFAHRFLQTRKRAASGIRTPGLAAAATALAAAALILTVSARWGAARIAALTAEQARFTKTFKLSLIQANIGDIDKLASERGFEPAVLHVLGLYRDMTVVSVTRFRPDLIVWPETAFPYLYTHMQDAAANKSGMARDQWVADFVREVHTPLFFGVYSKLAKRDFNSAALVSPPYKLGGLYRKSILLAFGEYVPLGPFGPLIQNIVPTIADFGRGKGPEVFELSGAKLAPQICYEGIFPEHSRGGVRLGADFLLNITNDSWFGAGTEPWLHLLLTAFRSIELRRPLVRSTNTGVSTVVDVTGEMRWSTRLFESGYLEATLKLPGKGQKAPETFYLWHGEIFAQLCAAFAAFLAAWLLGPEIYRRLRRQRKS